MASLPSITVLGSLNMDLVSYVSHHPEPGETMTSSAFKVSPGGKGANQAVACAKLSRRKSLDGATAVVRMVGAVGDDGYGASLRSRLQQQGVDVAGVITDPTQNTGVAVILVDEPTGQNRIVLSPGANFGLVWGGSLVPPSDLLILQLEIPQEVVEAAIASAECPVLLNPAPAPPTEEARAQLEAVWSKTKLAHLVLNETETAALVPGLTVADLDEEAGLERAAEYFLARGVQNVVMTLGGRGVYYATAAGEAAEGEKDKSEASAEEKKKNEASAEDRKGRLVPPQKVDKVVDTTAAGDTFVGRYALEVVYRRGKAFSCAEAVDAAQKASALTVQRKGAQDSIPWRDEL